MPVARHPPCSPGRAVFPQPVPRLSSRPRCKAFPSRIHPPVLDLRHARPCSPSPVQTLGALLPGKTLPLPPASIPPFKRTASRALEKAMHGAGGPLQTVVIVVAPQPAVHLPGDLASRHMPVLRDPFRPPSARRLELLARGASRDARHALAVWHPDQRASPQRDAPPHARMETTAA